MKKKISDKQIKDITDEIAEVLRKHITAEARSENKQLKVLYASLDKLLGIEDTSDPELEADWEKANHQ